MKTFIQFEHTCTIDELHELLCKVIHENDLDALEELERALLDIAHPDLQEDKP